MASFACTAPAPADRLDRGAFFGSRRCIIARERRPARPQPTRTRFEAAASASEDPYEGQRTGEARQDLFNRIAPSYDLLNSVLSFGQHAVWKRTAVYWSKAKEGDQVIDLCCGSGDIAQILGRKVGTTGKVIGADFACAQLDIAREKCNKDRSLRGVPFEWVQADVLQLPFDDESFDAATMGYGLRNVTDISKCFTELRRVLKPGAYATILDFNKPNSPASAAFQKLYLDGIVVPVASRFGLRDEYAYIFKSLEEFASGEEQAALARAAGFRYASFRPIFFGLMGVLVLRK
eukprot:tig00000042_g15531.t1